MGSISFYQATKTAVQKEEPRKRDSIRTGILLGLFNPMIIPYWAIGGTYLIANNWITTKGLGLEIFAVGASIGSFLCLYLFAKFALYIQEKFSFSSKIINRSIGVIFFALAILQSGKELFF
jgi:threonine/homoserine/homoserine lactone efflux protein